MERYRSAIIVVELDMAVPDGFLASNRNNTGNATKRGDTVP
jgi:hypothetical protein